MRTIILSLALLLTAHSQDKAFKSGTHDEILSDLRARQDVSNKSLITGSFDQRRFLLSAEDLVDLKEFIGVEPDRQNDKQALRDLKATYEKAIATRDLDLLKPHLASDFSAVMITADEVKDFDGIKAYWKKVEEFIGENGTYTVSVEPDDSIFDGNTAIAKGIAKEHVVRNGRTIDLVTRWTAIARKEDGTWKLVRIHAAIDPINNPIIGILNKGKLWITAGISAAVGLLFGQLFRRFVTVKPSTSR